MKRAHCRACGNSLLEVLELGNFALTGKFPLPFEKVPYEPMGLSWCKACSLVQMHYDYDQELFGSGYGYRSALNQSMVAHLTQIADSVSLEEGDTVVDIGGNDGTLLKAIHVPCNKVLIDPIGIQVDGVRCIQNTFDATEYISLIGKKAKVVFSIAMFYDLKDPVEFARQVGEILTDDGVWIFEQSYLPTMVERNAYDTICHEHLEYYSLKSIRSILEMAGLQIVNAELNDCNGGSIRITAGHVEGEVPKNIERLDAEFNEDVPGQFNALQTRMEQLKTSLQEAIYAYGRVVGYGASTKGNTLLQFCKIRLPCIVDVNPDKFGRVTPGTGIPIVASDPSADAYLVLPWHFRDFFIEKEAEFLRNGGHLMFPLPRVEIINASFKRSFVLGDGKRRLNQVYARTH